MTVLGRYVLQLAALGYRTDQIADQLGVTGDRVKWELKRACGYLRARNRTQAVAIALRRGDIR